MPFRLRLWVHNMKLDSEEQRKLLLEIIDSVPMQGDYAGLKKAMVAVDGLISAVQTAEIEVSDGK